MGGSDDETLAGFDHQRAEVVLGLVGAVGTDLQRIESFLTEGLQRFNYEPQVIKVTRLLETLESSAMGFTLADAPEHERIASHIEAGNELRRRSRRNDIFALYAAQQIAEFRVRPGKEDRFPRSEAVHLVHSLKHPEEVRTLRRIYGSGFFLMGVYSPEPLRLRNLADRHLISEEKARELIRKDENEKEGHGQHARDTFELSDVFIPMTGNEDESRSQVFRFLDLVFGSPWTTPTQEEHAMFMAFAAAQRSGSLARQVGAVVTSQTGDIIATGANDAPQYSGGQYWPGLHDQRDSARGVDSNDVLKRKLVVGIMRKVKRHFGQHSEAEHGDDALYAEGRELFADTGLLDITEYSREVHAEMAALSACARMGASTRGAHLYATTFPCHNCAKHIVAAGIERVYFVEPYPKSHALRLHDDSIALMDGQDVKGRVAFVPFMGVGPRRFFDLFSMQLSSGRPVKRKNKEGRKIEWASTKVSPRMPLLPYAYVQLERLAADELLQVIQRTQREPEGSGGEG
ncbi:cytidine deaminase [Corallococcus sp. AB032C]|uniref:anti-phage dCTP deaminase n=1 Tax=Corallococcus TaxID=83461 RepID=UPI000EB92730|nr:MULTISPECIES: anti-phage dCTP deaminase [Corallococcus]NPC52574.1 cytidine deaminase [Corallococcus exiguus]RKH74368.1 cytidine deaminase [Corallococcus sp. AB032C]